MSSPRYTVLIANRATGATRRFSFVRRPIILLALLVVVLVAVPSLVAIGARNAGKAEVAALRAANDNLRVENENYRAVTGELATQVESLHSAIDDLSREAQLDPAAKRAMDRLPPSIRARAIGGAI